MSNDVICPYCSSSPLRMTGRELHPTRPDLINKHYHVCRNCDAWVGCREGGWEPLGRLANAELRRAKQEAHAALDPIWQMAIAEYGWPPAKARNLAYFWINEEMNVPRGTNIGEFDLSQCQLVVQICDYRVADLKALDDRRQAYAAKRARREAFSNGRSRPAA